MFVHQIDRDVVDTFKAKWPCHGFPDNLDGITVAFAGNGDLVDFECYDENDTLLPSEDFDGSALVALLDDARRVAMGGEQDQ